MVYTKIEFKSNTLPIGINRLKHGRSYFNTMHLKLLKIYKATED